MTDTTRKVQVGIYLESDQNDKLNQIAAAMSRELGFNVSRSDAVARLITTYSLPIVPAHRTIDAKAEQAA